MIINAAKRTESVSEYYFSRKLKEIAAMNAEKIQRGEPQIINLGIGSPDGMPPCPAIEALCESAGQPGNHAYQSYVGIPELRKAFADWYSKWYGVELDPSREIQPLVGSKEGILLISMAFLDKGDKVLVPDPGYPTYSSASKLVEAEILTYDLKEDNGWQPDFEELENMDLSRVKLMWTNYPNMPTGDIEVLVDELTILNESELPPLLVQDQTDALEETRMRYRYLDLRRAPMQKNML